MARDAADAATSDRARAAQQDWAVTGLETPGARLLVRLGVNSRAGMCRPKSVSVCARVPPRIEPSVSEWQYTSHGGVPGIPPTGTSQSPVPLPITW